MNFQITAFDLSLGPGLQSALSKEPVKRTFGVFITSISEPAPAERTHNLLHFNVVGVSDENHVAMESAISAACLPSCRDSSIRAFVLIWSRLVTVSWEQT